MTSVLFYSLLALFFLNVPIAISIGLASAAAIMFTGTIPPVARMLSSVV